RAEIERRHTTRRPAVAPEEAAVDVPPEAPEETETNGDGHGDVVLAELEPQLEEHWARLAEAEANLSARDARIAELEAELGALKGLLEESADDFPDRADEWRYTLFYLRNEADIDGSLPGRFDALVEECFGELLGPRHAAAALAR